MTLCLFQLNSVKSFKRSIYQVQHGRYLENWYLEAGRDLGTSEADTEVGVL